MNMKEIIKKTGTVMAIAVISNFFSLNTAFKSSFIAKEKIEPKIRLLMGIIENDIKPGNNSLPKPLQLSLEQVETT